MIKTIKVKKQLRLDELIGYVWDNGLENVEFKSTHLEPYTIHFDLYGKITCLDFSINALEKHHIFIVEVEEEITEEMKFGETVSLIYDVSVESFYYTINRNECIRVIRNTMNPTQMLLEIRAIINGKSELVWSDSDE